MKGLIISNYGDALNSVRPEGAIFIGLQKKGYEITIMTRANGAYVAELLHAGIKIIDFHPRKKLSWHAIQFIRAELKKNNYDFLYLMNSKAISNGNFAAINLPVKVLVYRGVIGGSSWLNLNAYLKHLHPRVDGILAVSKAVQAYLQRQIWWNPQKVKQYYKGQDLAWFANVKAISANQLGLPENAFIVTCIANYRKLKGVRYLIEASNFIPQNLPIHFLLIGRKMDTKSNIQLIEKSPYAKNFHLLGYRNDVAEILQASHVYVQPTLHNIEGLGKAILEAMSLSVPPIVTNSGGPAEFVENAVSGFQVPPKNPKAIAERILDLYQHPELRKRLSKNAKTVIETKMSMQACIEQLDTLLKTLC